MGSPETNCKPSQGTDRPRCWSCCSQTLKARPRRTQGTWCRITGSAPGWTWPAFWNTRHIVHTHETNTLSLLKRRTHFLKSDSTWAAFAHRDPTGYWGQEAQDVHLHFHAALRVQCCFYTHRDPTDYWGLGALDVHLHFHTAPGLLCVRSVRFALRSQRRTIRDVHFDFHTNPELWAAF